MALSSHVSRFIYMGGRFLVSRVLADIQCGEDRRRRGSLIVFSLHQTATLLSLSVTFKDFSVLFNVVLRHQTP